MKPIPHDHDPRREIMRVGFYVVLAIIIWSVGWLVIHKIAEARHVVAVHARG